MRDRLTAFAERIGFAVEDETETRVVRATGVPCLIANRVVSTCAIEKSYDSANGKPNQLIGDAVHAVRVTIDEECDGRVYHADGNPIESYISGDGKTWSNISIRKGSQDSPEEDESASDLIHRYVKQIIGAVSAAGYPETASLAKRGPFKIPNTFEARAALGPVQDRIRGQRIAIIGLGGTGAYILDMIAKTPVADIHLLDSDHVDWHNFMRAPGAPTCEEIELSRKTRPLKVDYYHSKYDSLREGIHAHPVCVENSAMLIEFLSKYSIDYTFVCIDQRKDSDSPRQDVVYSALSEAGIPFIDSGVSITLDNHMVGGAVTTSAYEAHSVAWKKAIPNARVEGDILSYRNVQLPEVNALAASLAVMEWRRRTEQYVSESSSFLHKFRLEIPCILLKQADSKESSP